MSSISDEKAVITLEVELISKVSGLEGGGEPPEDRPFIADVSDDQRAVIEQVIDDSIQEAIQDSLQESGIDIESVKNITDNLKDVDSKGMSNITSMAKNPAGFIEGQFLSILGKAGPYGALAVALIATALATPELIKAVVEAFAVKGGALNQDYRYSQEEFLSQQFDRITQFKRLTGDDPVITVNTVGFVVGDPDFKGNSLVDANVARAGRVALRGSSYGYLWGI